MSNSSKPAATNRPGPSVETVLRADRVVMLAAGRIVFDGPPQQAVERVDFQRLFGDAAAAPAEARPRRAGAR